MWILQKKVLIGDLDTYAYFSETSEADINRDLSAAKEFETEAKATEFKDTHSLSDWSPIEYKDPGAAALQPWELEK